MISIKGIDKAEVLRHLYNAARPKGLGFFGATPGDMALDEARTLIEEESPMLVFDYVKGRVIKCRLRKDEFDPIVYDRDNGDGAAAHALAPLLAVLAPVLPNLALLIDCNAKEAELLRRLSSRYMTLPESERAEFEHDVLVLKDAANARIMMLESILQGEGEE